MCRDANGAEVAKVLAAPRSGTITETVEALPEAAEVEGGGRILQLGKLSFCTHPYLTGLICAVCGEKGEKPEAMTRVFVKGGHQLSVSKVRETQRGRGG